MSHSWGTGRFQAAKGTGVGAQLTPQVWWGEGAMAPTPSRPEDGGSSVLSADQVTSMRGTKNLVNATVWSKAAFAELKMSPVTLDVSSC